MFTNKKLIHLALFLIVSVCISSIKVTYKGFEKEKNKVKSKMASMQLGNYLRSLMLKVNNIQQILGK